MIDDVGEKKWQEDFSSEENHEHCETHDEEESAEEALEATGDKALTEYVRLTENKGLAEDDASEDDEASADEDADDDEASADEDAEDDDECFGDKNNTEDKRRHMVKEIREWVSSFAIAIALAAVIMFFFAPVVIFKQSMEPNFHSDDRVFASRRAYSIFGSPKRGDVIVFESGFYENGKELNYIKRVIGLPGETIAIKNGIVYINGEEIDEPYLEAQGISGEMEEMTIEKGRLFVMGDNRTYSKDSRNASVGTIEISKVIGKVVFRFYPLGSMKFF